MILQELLNNAEALSTMKEEDRRFIMNLIEQKLHQVHNSKQFILQIFLAYMAIMFSITALLISLRAGTFIINQILIIMLVFGLFIVFIGIKNHKNTKEFLIRGLQAMKEAHFKYLKIEKYGNKIKNKDLSSQEKTNRCYNEQEKRQNIIRIISSLLLILAVVYLIFSPLFYSSQQRNEYEFSMALGTRNKSMQLTVSNFTTQYDFIKSEGSISFILDATSNTEKIDFYLPKELEVYSALWSSYRFGDNEPIFFKNGHDYSIHNFTDDCPSGNGCLYNFDNLNITNYTTFVKILFRGKLLPFAKIQFNYDGGKFTPSVGSNECAFFRFYVEDKIGCNHFQCVRYDTRKLDFHDELVYLDIATIKNENGCADVPQQGKFYINYENEEKKKNSDLLREIALIVFGIGIASFIELLAMFFSRRR